ncbi:pro-corazonin [Maniola hyperantus]|uniref:pro-corazonin n=1 Tax=Aphantopus hyperantus TaxID=2795564 RepID=UPI0015697873|nr:pro-corazonin-like [Maniola hyperantus]
MLVNLTVLFLFVTMTSVASQTFQYSRGWTNGKRDGHKRDDVSLEKVLSPCQMNKLKYLLEGRPVTERLLTPCDYNTKEDDIELPRRYNTDRTPDPLYDAFQ